MEEAEERRKQEELERQKKLQEQVQYTSSFLSSLGHILVPYKSQKLKWLLKIYVLLFLVYFKFSN